MFRAWQVKNTSISWLWTSGFCQRFKTEANYIQTIKGGILCCVYLGITNMPFMYSRGSNDLYVWDAENFAPFWSQWCCMGWKKSQKTVSYGTNKRITKNKHRENVMKKIWSKKWELARCISRGPLSKFDQSINHQGKKTTPLGVQTRGSKITRASNFSGSSKETEKRKRNEIKRNLKTKTMRAQRWGRVNPAFGSILPIRTDRAAGAAAGTREDEEEMRGWQDWLYLLWHRDGSSRRFSGITNRNIPQNTFRWIAYCIF